MIQSYNTDIYNKSIVPFTCIGKLHEDNHMLISIHHIPRGYTDTYLFFYFCSECKEVKVYTETHKHGIRFSSNVPLEESERYLTAIPAAKETQAKLIPETEEQKFERVRGNYQLMKPVRPYIPEYTTMPLVADLLPIGGWLAPNGDYYPGYQFDRMSTWSYSQCHAEYAQAIAYQLLHVSQKEIDDINLTDIQSYLLKQGWARLDVESIMPDGIWGLEEYTQEQIQALKLLLARPPQKDESISREAIMKLLYGDTYGDK